MNSPTPRADGRPVVIALWIEMTPYHVYALRRMHAEAPDIRFINVFTHSLFDNSMPWAIELPEGVEILFDERNRIPQGSFFHRRMFGMLRFLKETIAAHRPDFVLLGGHADACRMMLIPWLRRRGIPIVHWTDSNVFGLVTGSTIRDIVRVAYLRTVLSRMDAFMPMGMCGRAYYHVLGGRPKPMFLRPYEPDYGMLSAPGPEAGADADADPRAGPRRNIVYSGRLVPWKKVDTLVEAFVQVAAELPDWDLTIAGGGPERARLERMVPDELRSRVRFTGFLQMEEVRAIYRRSHVLVHPSADEPWALVINEAVAAGLPVVVSYVTGAANELVRHRINGYVVAPGSTTDLAQALRYVCSGDRWRAMSARCAEVLRDWREAADPVLAIRAAVEHFRSARSTRNH